jgi:hypothetical protein
MSHSIVREFMFVALSGEHQGLVCELALCATSNMLDRSGRHVFKWTVGSVSENISVTRALASDDVECGRLRGSRVGALSKVSKMQPIEESAVNGPASVALGLFLRDDVYCVNVHTSLDLMNLAERAPGGERGQLEMTL